MIGPRLTPWQRWRRLTSFPWLWMLVYVLWVAFEIGVVAVLLQPRGWAVGVAMSLAVLPFALLAMSNWMLSLYAPKP